MKRRKPKGEKLDMNKTCGCGEGQKERKLKKTIKVRIERRAAKLDPETIPLYRKHSGYST